MTTTRFFSRPRLAGLLGGLTLTVAQRFASLGARLHSPLWTLRGLPLRLLLALAIVLRVGLPEAKPAYAATQTAYTNTQAVLADTPGCTLNNGCPTPTTLPAPEILYLSQGGLYAATAAQTASLRNIENYAIDAVLKLHSLPPSDAGAVQTWGRDDVLAQVYLALVTAIKTSASSRTVDQQNAVDWVTEVAKRRTVSVAVNAAREYVKWAALGRSKFDALMGSNPTKAQIEAFLSGPVLNYDLPTDAATEGWCAYRSPTPYGDDYKGYLTPTCTSRVIGIFLPPTPTYDEFVKWGAAKANYPLLSTAEYLSRAQTLGISLGVLLPLAAIIAGYAPYSLAAAAVATEAAFNAIGASAEFTSIFGATTSFLVGTGLALIGTILVAVAAAVILGINVTDAANLPGKLATLIETARNTTPDVTSLVSSTDSNYLSRVVLSLVGGTDGASAFLSIFVAATTPTPSLDSCDNSVMQPGMYELTVINTDNTKLTAFTPCLNPTVIPAASATDTQFVVKAKSTGAEALSPSITVKDATTGNVTSARLSQTWFVATTNGKTVQSLRLDYTDWNNKQQHAWLIGDITTGYTFLIFNSSVSSGSTLSPQTCTTDGSCAVAQTIQYIGGDGEQYSATLRPYQPPTGTPIFAGGAEGNPLTLQANKFAPGGAVAPITYQWNFKEANCNPFVCNTVSSATGDTVTYTWQRGGTYYVDLVATDKVAAQATTRLQVPISSLPPKLTFAPPCASAPIPVCNTGYAVVGTSLTVLRGAIEHAGTADVLQIDINWGDGQAQDRSVVANDGQRSFGGSMNITAAASGLAFNLAAAHNYANPGVYTGTITIMNVLGLAGDGGTVVRSFTIRAGTVDAVPLPTPIPTPIPTTPTPVPATWLNGLDGTTNLNPQDYPGYCLNLYGNVASNGAAINLWTCNGNNGQKWVRNADNTIRPKDYPNYCLNLHGNVGADGTTVNLWSCNGHNSQKWNADANHNLHPQDYPGFCLNLHGNAASNGGVINLWTCNGHNSQKWNVTLPAPGAWLNSLDGTTNLNPRDYPGYCLNLHGNVGADGTTVNLWSCTGHNSQQWVRNADNTIRPKDYPNYCLNLHGNVSADGATINLWTCNGHNSQKWNADANYNLHPQDYPNFCLNLHGNAASNGGVINLWTCNGNRSQQWNVAAAPVAAASVADDAAAQPLTTTTMAAAPVVTDSVPASAPAVEAAPVIADTPAVTTTQPAAPVDVSAPPALDTSGQNQRLFLPVVQNLAGAVLGSPVGIMALVLIMMLVGGFLWQRRRVRTGR